MTHDDFVDARKAEGFTFTAAFAVNEVSTSGYDRGERRDAEPTQGELARPAW